MEPAADPSTGEGPRVVGRGVAEADATEMLRRRLRNHLQQRGPRLAEDPFPGFRGVSGDVVPRVRPPATPDRSRDRWIDAARSLRGEPITTGEGRVIRIDGPVSDIVIDRQRLARLPGGPPPDAPLLCLDTETTGLGSAAGTVVFLVGLGWWESVGFRQVQLVLPDHPDEPAFLSALATLVPAGAWLVTYNGRGFDWPLLVTRFRLRRRAPPVHAGHLDLLSLVRRVFRHRLDDGRLRTVEHELLGLRRHEDLDGWEIPGRYLAFLRTGDADSLRDVARHNDEDVRSLARLLAVADERLCEPARRSELHPGDLLGLARAYRTEGRIGEALECLDVIVGRDDRAAGRTGQGVIVARPRAGAASNTAGLGERDLRPALDRAAVERARLLRHAGRRADALAAWEAIAAERGPMAGVAWVEIAKALEHEGHDLAGALAATEAAGAIADRSRALGRPLPLLEGDVMHRRRRLRRRLSFRRAAA